MKTILTKIAGLCLVAGMGVASLSAQLPFVCPKTITYYSYMTGGGAGNSFSFLGNEPHNVVFNADNSITVDMGQGVQTFAYSGRNGNDYMWRTKTDGSCYLMSADATVFCKIIKWTVMGITSELLRTYYTSTPQSPGYGSNVPLNSGAGSVNSSSSSPSNNRITCRKCNGKGRVEHNSYPPQYGSTKSYQKWCAECGRSYSSTLGHGHVTCGMCGGRGYTTR